MKTPRKLRIGLLSVLCVACTSPAQVPNTLYMQGAFLNGAGEPDPGPHSFQVDIFSNGTVVLNLSTQVAANADGLANFTVSRTNLSQVFQNATNTAFAMSNGPTQQFVTTPYAFQAGNLPMASGNFSVGGDLDVASNANLMALTAANGALLSAPVTIAKNAYFTNLSAVGFDGSLSISGGVLMEGAVEANYSTVFSSSTATNRFYGTLDGICLSNATIKHSFTCITNNLPTTGTSGTATEDGFLIVWITIPSNNETSGVYVNIDGLQFKLRRYANAAQLGQKIHMYTGSTFPVAQGAAWSVFLVNAQDSSDITIQCYWIPLRGNG